MRNMRPVNREIALFEGIEKQELEALMGCLKAYTRSYSAGWGSSCGAWCIWSRRTTPATTRS